MGVNWEFVRKKVKYCRKRKETTQNTIQNKLQAIIKKNYRGTKSRRKLPNSSTNEEHPKKL